MTMLPTVEALGRDLNDVEERFAPEVLFLAGNRELLSPEMVRVSIVGSRTASDEGLRRARRLARLLAEEQIVVVSGLALGIDTAAHEGAIAGGGSTVAVLGSGLDGYYPPQNKALQEQIAREHLVVSQFQPGEPPKKHSFPQRNRTMALISDATVIVEAGETSGSLHQGWEALRLARPLFLLESVVDSGLEWPQKMLGYGARVLCEVQDLMDAIPSPVGTRVALAI
jgi:DNA processing protein